MGMTIEQPESMEGGGKYIDKPGIYHCVVTAVDENPAKQDGTPLNGVQFTASVLAGTDASQKDKQIDVMMWNPSPQDEPKQQEGAKKVQTAFCLATCLIGHFQAGAKVTVEPSDAVGRQVVLKLRWRQKKDEATGQWVDTDKVQLSWSDIYHVDDEWVEKNAVPLELEAINLIPKTLRKEKKEKGTTAPSLADVAGAGAGAAAAAVDVGDV